MTEAQWFGGRLKELRVAARMTQPQLAEAAGMNRFGIAKLEQGVNKPTWETVLALAKALGVSCEAFTRPPEDREPQGPGRPKKEPPAEPAPKRPRGRPRKGQ